MTRIGYVLKVYPRFSETFVVTEILAREALGDDLTIYALRPTTDARFHPEISRVKADVVWVPRPLKPSELWLQLGATLDDAEARSRFAELLPRVVDLPGDEVAQGLALAQAVKRDGITHLHAHFASLSGRMAWIAHQMTGVPYTVTTHAKDIFHSSVDQRWLRLVCGGAARVLAISSFNEQHLTRVLADTPATITLCRNALELVRFTYRPPAVVDGPLRVLAVGRLVPKKGFADLITAAGRAHLAGVDLRVAVAGEGEQRDELSAQIEAAGLAEQVQLIGPKTQDEVCQLMADADVFVAPCVPADDGNIDGLPTVVLEAMAIGVPVVATRVTGLPEVVIDGQTGVLIEPGDIDALAKALGRLSRGELPVREMSARARRLIETDYDSKNQASRLLAWESGPGE